MSNIKLFETQKIRTEWIEGEEKWYFSVVDVIAVLTDSSIPKRYWSDLKTKLKNEGSEVYEKIVHLTLAAEDGKKYSTDCADTEGLLRIIQTVPSRQKSKMDPTKNDGARDT